MPRSDSPEPFSADGHFAFLVECDMGCRTQMHADEPPTSCPRCGCSEFEVYSYPTQKGDDRA